MSEVKREIIFQNSMTIDKRNPDFAYLRKNAFASRSKGLYPSKDFLQVEPIESADGDTTQIIDVLGNDDGSYDVKVIFERSTGTINIFNLFSASASNAAIVGSGGYECGAFGDDGVHIVTSDDKLWKVQHVNSDTTELYTFLEGRPQLAGFDGLYYWYLSSGEIYKQIDDDTPTIAFNDLGLSPDLVDFYNDQMVIFAQEGPDILVLFWDKSDADLFEKRILIRNAVLVAGGVVNGRLMLVKSVGNSSNTKERNGELVICGYDGEKFTRMNSIKTGQADTRYDRLPTGVGVGSEVMLFSVDENDDVHNPELYQNYIYKVHDDGAIEVAWLPDTVTHGDATVVRVFYNFNLFATSGGAGIPSAVFVNEDSNSNYAAFEEFTDTVYITNFLNNPYNFHKLDGLAVAFEKLYEQTDTEADPPTGEELDIYYRVSERDTFTLLGNVTVEKVKENVNARRDQSTEYASDSLGLPEQRYMITNMPDGSALPSYNEIQFKFVLKRGFSIIGAWYEYSYLSRNQLN